ncbi:MAG: response regulator [Phycisphaeraceae bacterium]|nr:response regulator [Phycisphaeraceae bacterium]
MNSVVTSEELLDGYKRYESDLRMRHAKVGCYLALVLMPAGTMLDLVVYPEFSWPFFISRWITNLFIAAVLILLYLPLGRKYLTFFGSAWVMCPAIAIAWMIYQSEGVASPYYAGLNLVIIIGCLLMPYSWREASVICLLVVGFYLLSCLNGSNGLLLSTQLFNNIYFISLTAIICITSCHYYRRRRIEDYRLRHEVDAQNRKLAELDKLKSDFFANVSHELRTPLTLILGPVESLLHAETRSDDFVVRQLKTVHSNGLRLLKLINDLLDMIRLDAKSGSPSAGKGLVDLASMSDAIASGIRHTTDTKGLSLRADGPQSPIYVKGDESSLERMFLNLLTNAIKFTPPGGAIEIGWRRDGQEVVVSVSDTGIGIPRDQLPHVFNRFRQVDGSSTRRHQGLGLGLALVNDIVQEHGGQITVQSELDKGTRFEIRLPIAEDLPGQETHQPTRDDEQPDPFVVLHQAAARHELVTVTDSSLNEAGVSSKPGASRLLIVDDEPSMQRYLSDCLSDEYNLSHAADGPGGLALACEEVPDLILLDLMLPGMDGLEVCRRLRAEEALADTRIILLTARADESAKLSALDNGADDFLTKPFSTVELKTRVRNLLRAGSLQRELRARNHDLEQVIRDLAAARSQLVQSEKMNALGSLAAGLLHEINNPLNFAMAALQFSLSERETLPPDVLEMLEDVHTGIRRVQDIIVDLRSFAHPGRGSVPVLVDLAEAATTARRFTTSVCDHVLMELDIPEGAGVVGNRSQIIQLLVNLITNAAKATQDSSSADQGRIKVSCQTAEDSVRLTVWDNGVGIEPSQLQRVFDPFYTTQDVGGGMGLGLSICHTIVTNHGGSISIRSEPDAWTEVLIDLPTQYQAPTAHETANQQ